MVGINSIVQTGRQEPRCLATAESSARELLALCRAEDPGAPFGGDLVLVEATRRGVQIVYAGDLGMPELPRAEVDVQEPAHHMYVLHRIAAAQNVTQTLTDETGADSVSIGGGGGTSFKTCAAVSYSDAGVVPKAVALQWTAEVSGLHFSSGATLAPPDDFCSATWVLKVNGSPVLSDSFIDSTNDAAVPGSTDRRTRTTSWTYELAPGDTAEISISVGGGVDAGSGATISWARTRLLVTALRL